MAAFGLSFVLIGAILGMGAYINTEIKETAGWESNSTEARAIDNATAGIANLTNWLPIIAVVAAAGIVLAILVAAFGGRGV